MVLSEVPSSLELQFRILKNVVFRLVDINPCRGVVEWESKPDWGSILRSRLMHGPSRTLVEFNQELVLSRLLDWDRAREASVILVDELPRLTRLALGHRLDLPDLGVWDSRFHLSLYKSRREMENVVASKMGEKDELAAIF